jgi:DNA invertase Pin-like site-specific DNA recombinase
MECSVRLKLPATGLFIGSGVAKAKAEGKYKGRTPMARAKTQDLVAKFKADQRPSDIAKSVGIGRASVYRILNDAGLV